MTFEDKLGIRVADPEIKNEVALIEESIDSEDAQRKRDVNKAREAYYEVIDDASSAADELLELAGQAQHPAFYLAYAKLLTEKASAANKLVQLSQGNRPAKEKSKEQEEHPMNIDVDKAVFIGNSSDLLKSIKGEKGK